MHTGISRYFYSFLVYFGIIFFGFGLLFFSKETSAAAYDGITLCIQAVVPSLFPFFVVSNLFVSTGLAQSTACFLRRPAAAIFGVSGTGASAFVLGIIGGYPVGAKTAVSLYQNGLCSKGEVQRLLCFCNNSGPAFILGMVGTTILGGKYGILLYGIHITASICVGVILKLVLGSTVSKTQATLPPVKSEPLIPAFLNSVTQSFGTMLNISAFVIFFAVVIRLLTITGTIDTLAQGLSYLFGPLNVPPEVFKSILSGGLEVTSGLWQLGGLAFSAGEKLTIAAFMLGWAGLSVHFQTLSFISGAGLSTMGYLVSKLLHGCISALLALGFAAYYPPLQAVFAPVSQGGGGNIFYYTTLAALIVLIIFILFAAFSIVFLQKRRYNKIKS